ncbi:MAG: hypothetical protein ABIH03_01340 [Pseudomonadota bacterium]
MTVRRYRVFGAMVSDGSVTLPVDGLRFLRDPGTNRLYRPGEVIEMDTADASIDVAGLVAGGVLMLVADGDDTMAARPACCPACGALFSNRPGFEARCNGCGADWPPPKAIETEEET